MDKCGRKFPLDSEVQVQGTGEDEGQHHLVEEGEAGPSGEMNDLPETSFSNVGDNLREQQQQQEVEVQVDFLPTMQETRNELEEQQLTVSGVQLVGENLVLMGEVMLDGDSVLVEDGLYLEGNARGEPEATENVEGEVVAAEEAETQPISTVQEAAPEGQMSEEREEQQVVSYVDESVPEQEEGVHPAPGLEQMSTSIPGLVSSLEEQVMYENIVESGRSDGEGQLVDLVGPEDEVVHPPMHEGSGHLQEALLQEMASEQEGNVLQQEPSSTLQEVPEGEFVERRDGLSDATQGLNDATQEEAEMLLMVQEEAEEQFAEEIQQQGVELADEGHQQQQQEPPPEEFAEEAQPQEEDPTAGVESGEQLQVVPDVSTTADGTNSKMTMFVNEELHANVMMQEEEQDEERGSSVVPTSSRSLEQEEAAVTVATITSASQEIPEEHHFLETTNADASSNEVALQLDEVIGEQPVEDIAQGEVRIFQEPDQHPVQEATMSSGDNGSQVITLPVTIGGQVQEVPVHWPEWATDLSQQNLVAIAEDGTQIPLTVIEATDEDVIQSEEPGGSEIRFTGEMLQQLTSSASSTSQVIHTMSSPQEMSIQDQSTNEGTATIMMMDEQQVIGMLQEQFHGMAKAPDGISASTSTAQFVFDPSPPALNEAAQEQEEMTGANIIHIPGDTYVPGQPIELEVVEVEGEKVLQAIPVPKTQSVNPPSRSAATLPPPPATTQTTTKRSPKKAMTTRESQRAIRSIGRIQVGRPQPPPATSSRKLLPRQPRTTRIRVPLSKAEQSTDQAMVTVDSEGGQEIQLSNTTQSIISPENMQALIQILQSMPGTCKGQTIQIILQNGNDDDPKEITQVPAKGRGKRPPRGKSKKAPVNVTSLPTEGGERKSVSKATTSDIAIQVSPEFIEENGTLRMVAGDITSNTDDERGQSQKSDALVTDDEQGQSEGELLAVSGHPQPGGEEEEEEAEECQEEVGVRRTKRKRKTPPSQNEQASKRIVTLEEQWVADAKPGVSYYAVIDYLSEHEPDGTGAAGYTSEGGTSLTMQRPEAPCSGFMEDHLELQSFTEEAKGRSLLESTVNSALIISPFRRGKQPQRTMGTSPMTTDAPAGDVIDLPSTENQSNVTLRARSFEQAQLEEGENLAEQKVKSVTKLHRKHRRGKPIEEKHIHKCAYCEFGSRDKILVVEHCMTEHQEAPVKTLSLPPHLTGRTCPYCRQVFDHVEFFSHMRFAHSEVHPYKCGYCDFMGRDRNQIRHHIQKKHRLPMKVIHLLEPNQKPEEEEEDEEDDDMDDEEVGGRRSSKRKRMMHLQQQMDGEESVYEYKTDEEEADEENNSDAAPCGTAAAAARKGLTCPECKKTFKTLKYLKTHIKVHQSHRYQCGYCDFISVMLHQVIRHCQRKHYEMEPKVLTKELEPEKNPIVSRDIDTMVQQVFSLNTRLPRDPDAAKWMRKWFCPHCDYTCQFGASYRRHLRMHANILPYKCNYCSFKGREKYYVRRHIDRMHPLLPMIVVENTPENCAGDTSSDEDFQEKGLRRKRRRRTKRVIHAVVPLVAAKRSKDQEPHEDVKRKNLKDRFQQLPVGERGMHNRKRRKQEGEEANLDRFRRLPGYGSHGYLTDEDGEKELEDGSAGLFSGGKSSRRLKSLGQGGGKNDQLRPFKCSHCNFLAMDKASIRRHSAVKHPKSPFKAEECHLASMVSPNYFMEMIAGHQRASDLLLSRSGAKGEAEETGKKENASPSEVSPQPQFSCPLCQSMVNYNEDSLKDHFFAHYEYYPFKCSECNFHATTEDKVVEHGTSHGTSIIVYQLEQEKPEGLDETIQTFLKQGEQVILQHKFLSLVGNDDDEGMTTADKDEEVDTDDHRLRRAEENEDDDDAKELFQCPLCDRQMPLHAVTVRRHLYNHYGYSPFRCGFCDFRAVSKASVRVHSVSEHPSFAVKVTETADDPPMPEDLKKMLHHIYGILEKSSSSSSLKATSKKVGHEDEEEDEEEPPPLTPEGRLWKAKLANGECPWCHASVEGGSITQSKLHAHLLAHFTARPFKCTECQMDFSRRTEVEQHMLTDHPGQEEVKIDEVVDDRNAIQLGLGQYLRLRKRLLGSKILKKMISAGITNAPQKQDEKEAPKEKEKSASKVLAEGEKELETPPKEPTIGEDNEQPGVKYQVVILSGDNEGTVVDLVPQEEEPATDRAPSSSSISEEPSQRTEKQEEGTNQDTTEALPVLDELEKPTEAMDVSKDDGTEQKIESSKSNMADKKDDEAKDEEGSDDDADVITLEGGLLRRSFRSETEASDFDDDDDNRGFSREASSNFYDFTSDEDDDKDDEAEGRSAFIMDIMTLLRHSSKAEAEAQKKKRRLKQKEDDENLTEQQEGFQLEYHCVCCQGFITIDSVAMEEHLRVCHPDGEEQLPLEEQEVTKSTLPKKRGGKRKKTSMSSPTSPPTEQAPSQKRSKETTAMSSSFEAAVEDLFGFKDDEMDETIEEVGKGLEEDNGDAGVQIVLLHLKDIENSQTADTSKKLEEAEDEEEETVENIAKMLQNPQVDILNEEDLAADQQQVEDEGALKDKTDPNTKKKSPIQKKTSNEKTTTKKATSATTRVTRSKRPATIQVGKYDLRGKGRSDADTGGGTESVGAKHGKSVKAEQEIEGTSPSSSTDTSKSRRLKGSKGLTTGSGLEKSLENLEECDENLPKMLQILQMKHPLSEDTL